MSQKAGEENSKTVTDALPADAPLQPAPEHPVPHRIPSLDGLRALAIALVLIGHGQHTLPGGQLPEVLALVIGNSGLGVLVFFCISGFLITRLLVNEESKHGRVSLKGFYIRRSFRILPAFFVFVAFIVVLKLTGVITITTGNIVSAALFVTNYSPYSEHWLLGHTWSLSIEEQFYLAWPLILVLTGRRAAMWIGIGLIFAMPFVRVGTYALMPGWRAQIDVMVHTRVDALMFGCVSAIAYEQGWFERLYSMLCKFKLHVILPLISLLIVPFVAQKFRGAYMLPVGYTFDALATTLGMLWLIRNPNTAVGRLFNLKFICWIGVLSYSLYLWQQVFFAPHDMLGWPTTFGLNFVLLFAVALGSYYLIEQPFLRLRAKVWK